MFWPTDPQSLLKSAQEIVQLKVENADLKRELDKFKKLVSEMQKDGVAPGSGTPGPRPVAMEAPDQVSATEAAAASKVVARCLFTSPIENDWIWS